MSSEISDEELRRKVAELCGFKWDESTGMEMWLEPDGMPLGISDELLPNYPGSLDACAEFEKGLTDEERHTYAVILAMNLWQNPNRGWQDWRDTLAVATAKPKERCLAFLAVKEETL